jgi:hypothetical protein
MVRWYNNVSLSVINITESRQITVGCKGWPEETVVTRAASQQWIYVSATLPIGFPSHTWVEAWSVIQRNTGSNLVLVLMILRRYGWLPKTNCSRFLFMTPRNRGKEIDVSVSFHLQQPCLQIVFICFNGVASEHNSLFQTLENG